MHKRIINIEAAWRFRNHLGQDIEPALFDVLAAIAETGKLTEAAKRAGYSYRHAWNLIHKWSDFFGVPLVDTEQGKGATLTPLGEKLAWAAQRIRARLGPQLDNLAAEIDLELLRAINALAPGIRVHASHGYAIARLPELMRPEDNVRIDLQYLGSIDALASLAHGNCDLCGFHVPQRPLNDVLRERLTRYLKPRDFKAIKLVSRVQGLYVAPGNPKKIHTLADLARPDVRFINRQQNSGTRFLLDLMLEEAKVSPTKIHGYESVEFTHAAVAAFIASGMADAGFGVQAAAAQFNLEFIPLAHENYCLAGAKSTWETPSVKLLLEKICSPEFPELIANLPGYDATGAGGWLNLKDFSLS